MEPASVEVGRLYLGERSKPFDVFRALGIQLFVWGISGLLLKAVKGLAVRT